MQLVIWSKSQADSLQEYAEAHPIFVKKPDWPVAGDDPNRVLNLTGGVRVAYSIEPDQPMGPCRHVSVSVDKPGKYPNSQVMLHLGTDLGFRPSLKDGDVWMDESTRSINWVQVKDLM